MCGIWGRLWFDSNRRHDVNQINQLHQLMAHRGPDGYGVWTNKNIALAHRRLSIIDVDGGQQPMGYDNDRYHITYNGEIYNYKSLRRTLMARGHGFVTESDTEIVLAAYAEWGTHCVQHFNGIFAFAIWDDVDQRLFAARDHMGIKPLLYHYDDEGFTFCSELKPLIAESRISQHGFSPRALSDYLANGYVSTPHTIVRNIYRLPPASLMVVHQGTMTISQYWDLSQQATNKPLPDNAETHEAFASLLSDAVQLQMVSDVPIGAFLSGGLDSSSIVSLMSDYSVDPVRAFTMDFQEASYSELSFAQQVANHVGADLKTSVSSSDTIADDIQKLVWIYDEPLGDTSLIPTYEVAELASRHTKVVLSGDGADELFAGYDTYVADSLLRYYRTIPESVRRHIIKPAINRMPQSSGKVTLQYRLAQFARQAEFPASSAHLRWRQLFTDSERFQILATYDTHTLDATYAEMLRLFEDVSHADWLAQMLYVDLKTWLVDDILVKVDRASMANGLEARVPFLDYRLVEFSMQLPPTLKMQRLNRKRILKQMMSPRLPQQVLNRQKRGFNAPTSIWLKTSLRDMISTLLNDADSELFDLKSPIIHQIWQEFLAGYENHGYKLWSLVSLLLWEKYVWREILRTTILH